jgi:hypothetical protein
MRHEQFRMGQEFWCGGRRWRCTDIGTRVVVAVCLEEHEVVTATQDPATNSPRSTTAIARDDWWVAGPPYALLEEVFDEHSIEDCSLAPDADDE